MHEIVGCILYVVELERAAWECATQDMALSSHPLCASFTSSASSVEGYTYALFKRIMLELIPLYDPTPTSRHFKGDNQPFVVR